MWEVFSEAREEHHVADVLMGELRGLNEADMTFGAKMTVLAENVKHHIEEEETEAFKKLRKLPKERLEDMAQRWETEKARAAA